MPQDYYDTLGVSKNASKDDIKKAYKKLAKKYHPDLNKDNPKSEAEFKKVNEAAKVLLDDQKRAQYDQFGSADMGGSSGFGNGGNPFGGGFSDGFGGFEDIFDSVFGGNPFGSGSRQQVRRGSDLLYELEITLKEAATGVQKEISITKQDTCETCSGRGYEKDEDAVTCDVCHGSGRVTRQQRTPFGIFQTQSVCSACGGSGIKIKKACHTCHGSGRVKKTKKLQVDIPAGIMDGQRLRMQSEGESAGRDGQNGDLFIEIHIKQDDIFERDDNDIVASVKISYAQAVLGSEISVPTLTGSAKLTIPAGTQSGTLFKMKGKGIPRLQGFGTGDQYVKVIVDVPTKLTKKQKELIHELDGEFGGTIKSKKSFVQKLKEVLE